MRHLFLFFVVLLFCQGISAQGYDPGAVAPEARKWYQKAQQAQMMSLTGAGDAVVDLLKKALAADPRYLDACAQLADIYEKQRAYGQAVRYYNQANLIDSAYLLPAYVKYARAEAGTGHFDTALYLVSRYLQRPDLPPSSRDQALAWQAHFSFGVESKKLHIPFQPENLGDSINTRDAEYAPSLTIDQKTLIFTRNVGHHNEDFFISHLRDDSTWSLAANLGPPINSAYNEGIQTVSQDGNLLVYAICNRPGGMGSCDLYYSVKTNGRWSEPANLGPTINSPYWDTQPCLSPDDRELYFVSNRKGGIGGSDIYVSELQADGDWGKPENLGPGINTPGDESSPFIHADNQTLYFASDGWPGLGGVDLYYTRRKQDRSWNKPVDLGYPINTIDHDGSLFVSADGKTAYFASDRSDSRGLLDLYRFTLYPGARPVRTLYVEGYVYNKKDSARLQAALDLVDLSTGQTLTRVPTRSDGSYLVTLPTGRDYAFNVSKPGYLFYSAHFSLKDTAGGAPFHITIGLEPLGVNARVTLKNIFFDFDQHTLQAVSHVELDRVVQLMETNPSLKIRIDGYTDSVGTAAHNQLLSQQRAQAVVGYLISKGIGAERMTARGYGAAHPVARNDTEEGRALNRRTELVVIAK